MNFKEDFKNERYTNARKSIFVPANKDLDQDDETSGAQLPSAAEKLEIPNDGESTPANLAYQHNKSEEINGKLISTAFLTTESSNDQLDTKIISRQILII